MTKLEECTRALFGELCHGAQYTDDEDYRGGARAVIACLMDVTPGIIKAGFEDYPTIWTAAITPEDAAGIWKAMLQHVLDEGETP